MKWGFKEKYGLQTGVLHETKTNTRREPFEHDFKDFRASFDKDNRLCVYDGDKLIKRSKVGIGDVVAVAQSYSEVYNEIFGNVAHFNNDAQLEFGLKYTLLEAQKESVEGWKNKMYVREDLMIHKVKVTGIKAERLQDISDEDCLKEGIIKVKSLIYTAYTFIDYTKDERGNLPSYFFQKTPRDAFALLIVKMGNSKIWQRNPWVFAYEFKLVK